MKKAILHICTNKYFASDDCTVSEYIFEGALVGSYINGEDVVLIWNGKNGEIKTLGITTEELDSHFELFSNF